LTTKRALVIGISDYDSLEHLDFCRDDGEAMSNLLSSHGYRINADHNLVGYVTWEKMREAIINFFTDPKIKPTDTLLFYYSGHGVPDEYGDIYFATSEIDHNFPYNKGYAFDELEKMIQRTISTKVILILDCCYSGSANLSKSRSSSLERQGKCILSSSLALQEAYYLREENHSLFTFYVLQGLEGQDREVLDKHGNITIPIPDIFVFFC
jgi:uncharacterized caspase-like protein